MNTYKEGITVRVTANFYTDNVLTNPTTLELHIEGPQTLLLSISGVVNPRTGNFHYDIVNVLPGIYQYYWRGTTGVFAWSGDNFRVNAFKKSL